MMFYGIYDTINTTCCFSRSSIVTSFEASYRRSENISCTDDAAIFTLSLYCFFFSPYNILKIYSDLLLIRYSHQFQLCLECQQSSSKSKSLLLLYAPSSMSRP
mmetsp:Transcript_2459/g.2864  ORF Transcript_2459/g.2864 Transcript_2459/m.2864 type:complete len:103 (-) Transcript_2459:998-1306(-)